MIITIAKAFELHDGIRKHETRVIGVVKEDKPTHNSKHQWTIRVESKLGEE